MIHDTIKLSLLEKQGFKKYEIIGANKDWKLTENWGNTPCAMKWLDKVTLMVFLGINGHNAELSIHYNKYIPCHQKILSFNDFESACNEADDYYRALLTEEINYAMNQLRMLPEI